MFGFFKRKKIHVSFSPEVQLLWSEFEKLRIRSRGKEASVEKAIDVVAQELFRQLTHEGTFAADLVLRNGWSVGDAANMMIAEHVSAEILTGRMHSHRGVLNDRGKAYLQLFKTCTERMISSGRMPAQQAYAGIRAFEEEIASLG
ncbi:hypothetical protein ELG72_37630 [Rhizobium leguminosarum]|nr:hypothetical protein ELG82_37470 [Rhizobium leguminosarum]TBG07130.1 hypothetical protein ELG80_37225 [Rhizobium leguminosarum]TBG07694.1 hypothetical protein ELG81_37530 [Rhizobium leguminosarum]TBG30814.1 hypothetical protein ELG75_36925 [Rhizobium leguminosarum]TBG50060.1 hypothetical protein ELG72_37630 [Rhizobium leguminosarum]